MCGSIDHAMICQHGGLTFIRNNELRELTANWLKQVCHDVSMEPSLLPLNGELIATSSANCSDSARTDIMHGASGAGDKIDVRVFHPNALSYRQAQVASLFHRHELEKKQIFHSTCFLNFWWFIYLFI